jgi:hypothetical protein
MRRLALCDENCYAEMRTLGADSSPDNPTVATFVLSQGASSKLWFPFRSVDDVQGAFGLNKPDFGG